MRVRHTVFLIVATLALKSTLFAAPVDAVPPPAAGPSKPNLIVIYTDDHGYADLGIQGVFPDLKRNFQNESWIFCCAKRLKSMFCG